MITESIVPGDPKSKLTIEERFWTKVNVRGLSDCWEWTAYCNHFGYGMFHYNGGPKRAHRVAWELTHGPIPKRMWVLHHCDNPLCVNPKHLYVGVRQDNIDDMYLRGRNGRLSSMDLEDITVDYQ